MTKIVEETERGFLFRDGKFVRMLMPGKYRIFSRSRIMKIPMNTPAQALELTVSEAYLSAFAKDGDFAVQTTSVEVPDGQVALHYMGGRFQQGLEPGSYHFWNTVHKHEFQFYDTRSPEIDGLPRDVCEKLQQQKMAIYLSVKENEQGVLRYDGVFERLLEPGAYYFWAGREVTCERVITALQELSLTGQEILTKDRVGIRLNFLCSYRFTDVLKATREIEDVGELFRTSAQLTVRDYVSGLTLDELLAQRAVLGGEILKILRPRAEKLYIEVVDAGIRDVILPGDIRDIMNTVLLAEKKAQANVITRREEVASTRSLLNTARLMDENQTLYKLKELEYLERICEHVGNISLSGGDLLGDLRAIIGAGESKKE